MEYTNVLFIFLGSILTFLSTWLVETIKNSRERNEKQENFKLFVRQELRALIKGFEKLKTILEFRNYYDYIVLNQLDKNVFNLESYKKEAVYLSSADYQEKFIDLISDIASFVTDIRGMQNFYYEQVKPFNESPEKEQNEKEKKVLKKVNPIYKSKKELDDYFNSKKNEKAVDMVELKRRVDEFAKQISN
jgi:hypothetical protein